MSSTRGRDTTPELAVRRRLHSRGWRYRINYRPLADKRRSVDVAFTKKKLAVMIDGCFWHGCPTHYRPATTTRTDFWNDKITVNQARDLDTTRRLVEAGWRVLRFWEHEDPLEVVAAIEAQLSIDLAE